MSDDGTDALPTSRPTLRSLPDVYTRWIDECERVNALPGLDDEDIDRAAKRARLDDEDED